MAVGGRLVALELELRKGERRCRIWRVGGGGGDGSAAGGRGGGSVGVNAALVNRWP